MPVLALFVRLTLAIAAVLVAIVVLTFLIKIAFIALVLGAIAFGALFLYNFARALFRRPNQIAGPY